MNAIIIALFAILIISGCADNKNKLVYLEIVHERADCNPYCSTEYILFSNGTMMKKQSNDNGPYMNKVELVKVAPEKALSAIMAIEDYGLEYRPERCDHCNRYTLLTLKDGAPFMHVIEEERAAPKVKEIFDDSSSLFFEGEEIEQFFVQFVYTRLGQNTIDYHIFSDGSVLKEEFIGQELVLGAASAFEIEEDKIDLLKEKFDSKFFNSKSGLNNCTSNGLSSGYMQVMKGEFYSFEWTCGTLESRVDDVFNEMMEEYG